MIKIRIFYTNLMAGMELRGVSYFSHLRVYNQYNFGLLALSEITIFSIRFVNKNFGEQPIVGGAFLLGVLILLKKNCASINYIKILIGI
jgi:hypothetical protein